ncbi:MAG: hypothetical protein GX770_04400 [Firmicutes bacterium]|nr:hypothetical protein [Bacillota bacterium]
MFRYIAGILTAFLFIGSVFGFLYILDQYNYIELKPAILVALSTIPGWEEVPEAYRLGLQNMGFLQEREEELTAKADALASEAERLETERQTLIEQLVALQEKEEYLALQERKMAEQQAEFRRTQELEEINQDRYVTAARLLEAMSPEVAGENLLKMPFEMGVAVLSLLEPRRAGRILETLPPEQSSKYMAEISGH